MRRFSVLACSTFRLFDVYHWMLILLKFISYKPAIMAYLVWPHTTFNYRTRTHFSHNILSAINWYFERYYSGNQHEFEIVLIVSVTVPFCDSFWERRLSLHQSDKLSAFGYDTQNKLYNIIHSLYFQFKT